MKKMISWILMVCMAGAAFTACNTAPSSQQEKVDAVLHLALDAPNEELTALLFREDAINQTGEGTGETKPYENGYYNLLREKLGSFFTQEAYKRFEQSDAAGMYHFITFVTKQALRVEKISYEAPDKDGKINFAVEVTHTLPTGESEKGTIDGFAVFENEAISDFYLGGAMLHTLKQIEWKPEDVPVFPMP